MFDNLESLISVVPTGVVVVNNKREIVYMNPYARDIILSHDYFGKDILQVHDSVNGKRKIEGFFSRLTKDKAVELPVVKILNFKDKSLFFLVKLTKIYDENDQFAGIVAIFYDITNLTMSKIYSEDYKQTFVLDKIPVMYREKIVFLHTSDIIYIKSIGSSTIIYDRDGNEFFTNLKISELGEKLSSKGFFRSHKSYLANLAYLKELVYDKRTELYKLHLECGNVNFLVPLSKRSKLKLSKMLSI